MTTPSLKLREQSVQPQEPWADDALQRKPAADALTDVLKGEANPLVVSLNGTWGTGKTFVLKRWQAQLKLDGCQAIYFNAWEDDYCGDPLVAIIGQLWQALKDSDWKEIGNSVKESAKPLLTKTVFNVVRISTAGIVDLTPDALKSVGERALDDYYAERANRDNLKERLTKMAADVAKATGYPLVFIIDELDRCRPTFAIELLERIKHVFDIPHLVFVLGIDRNQLSSSVQAVYGSIDVDGYLRRFFDVEFELPAADSALFCKHLMERHDLASYFQARSVGSGSTIHQKDYDDFLEVLPELCDRLELSLRDMEHVMRLLVFAGRNVQDKHRLFPVLLSVLLLLRVKNYDLYLQYVQGKCLPSNVLNYIEKFIGDETRSTSDAHRLLLLRVTLYATAYDEDAGEDIVGQQLKHLAEQQPLTAPEHLSEGTKKMDKDGVVHLLDWYHHALRSDSDPKKYAVRYLSKKIELAALMLKKQG